jgi:hypothetical protein
MKHSIAFMALTVLLINAIPTASAQLPNQFQPQNPKPGDWIDYRPFPSWEPEKVLYLQDIPHSYAVQFLLKGDLQVKKGEKGQYLAGPVYLKFKGIFDPQNAAVEEIKPGFIMALTSAVVIITDVEEQGALEGKRVFLTVTSGNLLINKISDQYFPFYSRVLNQNGEPSRLKVKRKKFLLKVAFKWSMTKFSPNNMADNLSIVAPPLLLSR